MLLSLTGVSVGQSITANHTSVPLFESIPDSVVREIRSNYRIFYGHTSHGSQIVTGMQMLMSEDTLYRVNDGDGSLSIEEYGSDLGHLGDTSWAQVTRQRLDQPGSDINVVVWSWCGGVSDNTVDGIATYLAKMADLELDYPNVKFIYMTGHLDGTGPTGNLYLRNNQIRQSTTYHGDVLFDFADIESYDPDGVWYPDETDACAWCADWCSSHGCPTCGDCAHSHCFNCYQKGKAFWWLMAEMIGWDSTNCCVGVRGDVNMSGNLSPDLLDLSLLIAYLTTSPKPFLPCIGEANVNGDAGSLIDISDLSLLIWSLVAPPRPVLPNCP
ncbi:MAG: hypothetical protein IPH75_00480 [bacterium]|nr:hypothetical protein [bacterium]